MRAKYCKSKNTYTIKNCKNCKCQYYWKQGIGSIHNDNHVSNIVNQDTERVETHTSSVKTSQEGNIVNINTTRVVGGASTSSTTPTITSGSVGINLNENSGSGQVVYTIVATDIDGVVDYEISGTDAGLLTLTGNVVTLDVNPDFETKSSYSFGVTATNSSGGVSSVRSVTFNIVDVVEVVPLLDTYTSSSVAYSLRQLSSSASNVVRVRRGSDDTEQDFSSDEITDGTLTTFVGSGDGFVSIIYDQSGNGNDGVQTNTSSQPKIIDSGSLILDNNEPSMLFSGSQSLNFNPFQIDKSNGFFCFYVTTYLGVNNHRILSMGSSGQRDYVSGGVLLATRQYGLNGENIITLSSSLNGSGSDELNIYKSNSTSNAIIRNSVKIGTSANTSTSVFTPSEAKIGGQVASASSYANARIKEVIVFNNDQSTNESLIEQDINDYYSIY